MVVDVCQCASPSIPSPFPIDPSCAVTTLNPSNDVSDAERPAAGRRLLLAAIVVILVGAALRWAPVEHLSFSGDEAWTLRWSRKPVSWVMSNYFTGLTMHAYILLVKGVEHFFGYSALALKLPSLIAATLTLPLFFVGARRWVNAPVAVVAVLLAAFDPRLIVFSRIARVYAMLVLWAICSMLLASRIESTRKMSPFVLLGLVNGLGIALSLSAVSIVAAQATWFLTEAFLAHEPARRQAVFRGLVVSCLVAGVSSLAFYSQALPGMLAFATKYSGSARPWLDSVGGAAKWLHHGRSWVAVIGLLGAWRLVRGGSGGRLVVAWAAVPILMTFLSDTRLPPSAIGRTLFVALPAHLILMAAGWVQAASWVAPRRRTVVAAGLALVSVAWTWTHVPRSTNLMGGGPPHPLTIEKLRKVALPNAVVLTTKGSEQWIFRGRVPAPVRSVTWQIKTPRPLRYRRLLVVSPRRVEAEPVWREAFWIHRVEGEHWQGRYVVLESKHVGALGGDRAFRVLLRGMIVSEEHSPRDVSFRHHRRLSRLLGALASLEADIGEPDAATRYGREAERHRQLADENADTM